MKSWSKPCASRASGLTGAMTDRRTRYEARRRESGWRHITVRLDADTLAALERLATSHHHGDRSAAVRAAILDAGSREQR